MKRTYAITGYGLDGKKQTHYVEGANRREAMEKLDMDGPFVVKSINRMSAGLIVILVAALLAVAAGGVWLFLHFTAS